MLIQIRNQSECDFYDVFDTDRNELKLHKLSDLNDLLRDGDLSFLAKYLVGTTFSRVKSREKYFISFSSQERNLFILEILQASGNVSNFNKNMKNGSIL